MNPEENPEEQIWMISNRQPWPYALTEGLITSKTRSAAVHLPPVCSTVLLHASKTLWRGWRNLWWVLGVDVRALPRGGVVAVANLAVKGPTGIAMPPDDRKYFDVEADTVGGRWSCAGPMTMVFSNIRPVAFIPCRGAQVPTRKIPDGVLDALREQGVELP
jgi:hypothetical protein